MRKLLLILFLAISVIANATNYYVSTTGSNSNSGLSTSAPWATWQYGFDHISAGDVLYIRAGTYTTMGTSTEGVDISGKYGTSSNPITVMGYPGEAMPILDCSSLTASGEHNGIYMSGCSYWNISRLEIRNCKERGSGQPAPGWTISGCDHMTLTQCVLHDNDNGFVSYQGGDQIKFINCDSYSNGLGSYYYGNNGFYARSNVGCTTYYIGCRAWGNGQDGYDSFEAAGTGGGNVYWDKCWAFSNSQGTCSSCTGAGFKMGTNLHSPSGSIQKKLTNCIAADEPLGYDESQDAGIGYSVAMAIYNCVSYNNGAGWNFQWGAGLEGIYYDDIIRNNISYLDGSVGYWGGIDNIKDHNSWDIRTPVASDFVSTNISQLSGARQSDGSLPVITFMHLTSSATDFINAGINVGLLTDGEGKAYDPTNPSIGAYEYGTVTTIPVTSVSVAGTGGATTITVDNGTLQMIETVLPADATTKTVTWSLSSGGSYGTISTGGLLTAVSNGTVIVRATANNGIYGERSITLTNQLVSANYYVSTTGSDSNNGLTVGTAFLTFKHACDVATGAGSIINVGAGTFNVSAQCNLAIGVSVVGQGATSILRSTYASNPLLNLVSGTEGTNGNQSISFVKFDGNNLTGTCAMHIYARKNVIIHDCTFIDFRTDGIIWTGKADGSPNEPTTYATGNEFYNNTITNCAAYNGGGYNALKISGHSVMLIHHNTLTQTGRTIGTNGWPIAGRWHKGTKIYNNVITKEPYDGITFDFALELWYVSGLEIYNNTIKGSTDLNFLSKGTYTFSVDFHDNIVGPSVSNALGRENGVILELGCSDVIIRNNLFNNLFGGVYVYGHAGTSDVYNNINIYYNVANASRLLYWQSGDNTSIVNNVNVWNNTCKMGTVSLYDAIELPDIGTATNISIRNNIVVGYNRSPVFTYQQASGISINIVSIENNIFYGNGNSNNPLYQTIVPTNVTLANTTKSNPLFVSTTDFSLQAGSPAINAGLNVGLTTDIRGNSISGLPDIGAYEFNSIIGTPTITPGSVRHKGDIVRHQGNVVVLR